MEMTDKEIYERWKFIDDLYETLDEEGNVINMSEEEGIKLALQFNEALNILMAIGEKKQNVVQHENDKSTSVFPLIKKFHQEKKPIIVSDLVDKYIRWVDCDTYKKAWSAIEPFDPEWELNKIFYELYDDIDDIISGKIKLTLKSNLF